METEELNCRNQFLFEQLRVCVATDNMEDLRLFKHHTHCNIHTDTHPDSTKTHTHFLLSDPVFSKTIQF